MRRLFPEVYWDPTGKCGIIDTGKTVEFWLKPCGRTIREIVDEHNFNEVYRSTRFKGSHLNDCIFPNGTHHVSLARDIQNIGVGVCLTIDSMYANKLFKPNTYVNARPPSRNAILNIGQVPSNSNIHKILTKKFETVKSGRLVKLQVNPEFNMKVRFPYGIYVYNSKDEIVIDQKQKTDGRFQNLVIDEDR